ncbi:hypothetical protein SprV_0200907000 [Sparganum proliferum]
MQLGWGGHLVRMYVERLPKRLFYGNVATGSRRQGGRIRRYKDTLKSSLKRLQVNPTNWEELALDRSTWRRTVKTGAAIYEANRIAAAKVKRQARKSQFFCTTTSFLLLLLLNHYANPDTTTDTTPTVSDSGDEDQDCACPHCDRTLTSRIGLVGRSRIHRTETGEPVPAAPTYTHRTRLHCPHCPRTLTHRTGLFGHMRIHDDLRMAARKSGLTLPVWRVDGGKKNKKEEEEEEEEEEEQDWCCFGFGFDHVYCVCGHG